jgi:ABC-type bacteriocin/lantibiotic exporter with double-glycine peptidase domain
MNSVLSSLLAIARRHGLNPSIPRIIEQYGEDPAFDDLVKIATEIGLSAGIKSLSAQGLGAIGKVYPILAELKDGRVIIIPGFKENPEGVVSIATLSAKNTKLEYLSIHEFTEMWSGRIAIFKPQETETQKEKKKFDFQTINQ